MTEFVFNITRNDYPVNLMKTDLTEIIKQLLKYRETIRKLSEAKDNKVFEAMSLEEKKESNYLSIYTFFLNMINSNQDGKIDTLQSLFLTQYLIAKRIDDLEELIQNLQDIVSENLTAEITKLKAKQILEGQSQPYPEFAKQLPVMLEVFYKQKDESELETVNAKVDDLERLSDYDDEIAAYSKEINKKQIESKKIWDYNTINIDSLSEDDLFKGEKQKELLFQRFKDIVKLYSSAPKEVHKVILEQYKLEYIGINMAARVFELELILKEYLIALES